MKNSIILPAFFLFCFIIVIGITTGLNILEQAGRSQESGPIDFINLTLTGMRKMLPAAGMISLLSVFLRILRKPGPRLLDYLLLLLVAAPVLILGELALSRIATEGTQAPANRQVQNSPQVPGNNFKIGQFTRYSEGLVYAEKAKQAEGAELAGIVFIRSSASTTQSAQGSTPGQKQGWTIENNFHGEKLSIDATLPGQRAPESPESPESTIFSSSVLPADLINDYEILIRDIILAAGDPWEFGLLYICFIFAVLSTKVFTGITRWPLANILLCAVAMRGILLLYAQLSRKLGAQTIMADELSVRLIPLILLGVGILLILVDIIFIPTKKQEGQGK